MKIHVLSDLHLEVSKWQAPETDADVIVLAGDIGRHTHGLGWAAEQPAFAGKLVIYIPGNHEFYEAELIGLRQQLYAKAETLRAAGHRIHVLDCNTLEFAGVRFLGATLWTDYRLFGDGEAWTFAMQQARLGMTDHFAIFYADQGKRRGRFFLPEHAYRRHMEARRWLARELAQPFAGKTVVVTHHLPSAKSVAERFGADPLSAAFASNMEDLTAGADLWIHGHTHDNFDYLLGNCRVVCNPRGYVSERYERRSTENKLFDPHFVVET